MKTMIRVTTVLLLTTCGWPADGLVLDALPAKVLSARTLTGGAARFTQDNDELFISVPTSDRKTPVTVVELTLDQEFLPGTVVGTIQLQEIVK